MNRLILTFSVIFCLASFRAQTGEYAKLKKVIESLHPEIITDNKLVAYNVWSISDQESREANKSFEKVYQTYENARLKGGLQGIVVVVLNKDNLSGSAVITLHKDGVSKSISLKAEDASELNGGISGNAVFDSNGVEVYRNIPAVSIFSKIQQLVTR